MDHNLSEFFGNQNKSSTFQLFASFSNNLYLGQWELARSCALALKKDDHPDIVNILLQCTTNPMNLSVGAESILTPHDLSWLALHTLISLDVPDMDVHSFQKEVGYRLLLTDCCKSASSSVIEDLYIYHKSAVLTCNHAKPGPPNFITEETRRFLIKSLQMSPALGHHLLQSLLAPEKSPFSLHNFRIYQIYLDCMNALFKDISTNFVSTKQESKRLEELTFKEEAFCKILALYDPEDSMQTILRVTRRLFVNLVKWLFNTDTKSNKITLNNIYGALLGKRSLTLLETFLKVDFDYHRNSLIFPKQELDVELEFVSAYDEEEDQSARRINWHQIFLVATKKNEHFLELILDKSMEMIHQNDFEKLQLFLAPPEFAPLRPLVLLVGWDHCSNLESGKKLFEAIATQKEACDFGALRGCCDRLGTQLGLIEWGLDNVRNAQPGDCALLRSAATCLFRSLDVHSAMYMLNQFGQLTVMGAEKVIAFIKDMPNSTEQVGKSPAKTVHFKDDGDSCKDSPSLVAERDISIYHSYCALSSTIDAILLSSGYGTESLSSNCSLILDEREITSSKKTSDIESVDHSHSECSQYPSASSTLSAGELYKQHYEGHVTRQLNVARDHLSQIYPLCFRLETLENLYSLLFVRCCHVHGAAAAASSGGEDDPHAHIGILTPTMSGSLCGSGSVPLTPSTPTPADGGGGGPHPRPAESAPVVRNLQLNFLETKWPHNGDENQADLSKDENVFLSGDDREGEKLAYQCHSSVCAVDVFQNQGFIANEYIVRDVHHIIKESLVEMKAAHNILTGKQQKNSTLKLPNNAAVLEAELSKSMICSIDTSEFKGRLSRLNKYVSEGQWRLELVSEIVLDFGVVKEKQKAAAAESTSDDDSSVDSKNVLKSKSLRRRLQKNILQETSSAVSSSCADSDLHSDLHGTDGSASTSSQKLWQRNKRKKQRHRAKVQKKSSGIIPRMLASHESLLNMCLHNGKLVQAAQVVKIFDLGKSAGGVEVKFAQEFQAAVKSIESESSKAGGGGGSSHSLSSSRPKLKLGSLSVASMRDLADIAGAGVSAGAMGVTVDKLLHGSVPPLVPPAPAAAALLEPVSAALAPAAVVLDLACCAGASVKASASLIDLACRRRPDTAAAASHSATVPGVTGFLDVLLNWSSLVSAAGEAAVPCGRPGLRGSLLAVTRPLHAASLKPVVVCGQELERALREAETALGAVVRGVAAETPGVRVALHRLIVAAQKHLPPGGVSALLAGKPSTAGGMLDYLQGVYEHSKALSLLCAKWQGHSQNDLNNLEYFTVLKKSPTAIIGSLICTNDVAPQQLVSAAARLAVSLAATVVTFCCPHTDVRPTPALTATADTGARWQAGGKLVLNAGEAASAGGEHPGDLVQEVLDALIHLIKGVLVEQDAEVVTSTSLRHLAASPACHSLLARTRLLTGADLALLSGNEARLSFYINLYNLLTLHAHIHTAAADTQADSACGWLWPGAGPAVPAASTALHQLLAASAACYTVGQLGTVSLYDIREVLLRQDHGPSGAFAGYPKAAFIHLDAADPWCLHGVCCPAPARFCLSSGLLPAPPLITVTPDTVNDHVRAAEREVMEGGVTVTEHAVYVPELVLEHFCGAAAEEEVLDYVCHHTSEDLESRITALRLAAESAAKKSPKKKSSARPTPTVPLVRRTQHASEVCYTLSFPTWRKRMAADAAALQSNSADPAVPATTASPHPLSASSLTYLRSHSELLAALASFSSCRHAAEPSSSPSSSPHSSPSSSPHTAVDVFSDAEKTYRYVSLTQQYPVLHRQLYIESVPLWSALAPSGRDADADVTWSVINERQDAVLNAAFLCGPKTASFGRVVLHVVARCMERGDWRGAAAVLKNLDVSGVLRQPALALARDLVFQAAGSARLAADPPRRHDDDTAALDMMLHVTHHDTRVRCLLSLVHRLSLPAAIRHLRLCLRLKHVNATLTEAVTKKLSLLSICEQVTTYARRAVLRWRSGDEATSQDSGAATLEKLAAHWRHVEALGEEAPAELLEVLLAGELFAAAERWVSLSRLDATHQLRVAAAQVAAGLRRDAPDYTAAATALERVVLRHGAAAAADLAERLLLADPQPTTQRFLADFMLQQPVVSAVPATRHAALRSLSLGAAALLLIPAPARAPYSHLAPEPALILEMLLMNMKIELVSAVLELFRGAAVGRGDRPAVTPAECDALLARYASRAVEFVATAPATGSEGSLSRSDSLSSLPRTPSTPRAATPLRLLSRTPTMPGAPMHDAAASPSLGRIRRTESDSMFRISSLQPPARATPTTPDYKRMVGKSFVVPAQPPSREQWVPDSAAPVCMVCTKERFSMLVRRHHCRRCGRVVCAACSARTTPVAGVSARTCDTCWQHSHKPRPTDHVDKAAARQPRDRSAGSSDAASGNVHFVVGSLDSRESMLSSEDENEEGGAVTERVWTLTLDSDHNEDVRAEFYYEHAPSTSLCLSLLELHSAPASAGAAVLCLADAVSTHLQPAPGGGRDPEVDYTLVLSMLKHLLFHAKLLFLRHRGRPDDPGADPSTDPGADPAGVSVSAGVAECDRLTERVRLLDLLVSNNCSYVPSIAQLSNADARRRLRDKLIEEERLPLAMEISTKCGIEAAGVWVAWGKSLIKRGDLRGAREKLSRVLRAPSDRGQAAAPGGGRFQPTPSGAGQVLADVVRLLEMQAENNDTNEAESILAQLQSMKTLLAETTRPLQRSTSEESALESVHLQECVFYLQTYGSHAQLVSFYQRHGCLRKALTFILAKHVRAEVFVECVWVPCVVGGAWRALTDALTATDPTRRAWTSTLTHAAAYMERHGMHRTLYSLQTLIKDHVRAYMTCVSRFYPHGARTYVHLQGNLQHLQTARGHLEAYVDDKLWLAAPEDTAGRKILTFKQVQRAIKEINLQIEVTKFVYLYHDNYDVLVRGGVRAVSGPVPPTLLGRSTATQTDTAALVLLCGNHVNDGVGLAMRIIQELSLNPTHIFVQVAKQFAKLQKFASLHQLLDCIKGGQHFTDQTNDEIIMSGIKVIDKNPDQMKDAEALIRLLKSDVCKIDAYMSCGKLKSAYLIAVKLESRDQVQRIAATAANTDGQKSVKLICDKWLKQRDPKPT